MFLYLIMYILVYIIIHIHIVQYIKLNMCSLSLHKDYIQLNWSCCQKKMKAQMSDQPKTELEKKEQTFRGRGWWCCSYPFFCSENNNKCQLKLSRIILHELWWCTLSQECISLILHVVISFAVLRCFTKSLSLH